MNNDWKSAFALPLKQRSVLLFYSPFLFGEEQPGCLRPSFPLSGPHLSPWEVIKVVVQTGDAPWTNVFGKNNTPLAVIRTEGVNEPRVFAVHGGGGE